MIFLLFSFLFCSKLDFHHTTGFELENDKYTTIVFTADRHLCFLRPHMRIQLCLVGKMHWNAAKCTA
jgi:hypothetical protein